MIKIIRFIFNIQSQKEQANRPFLFILDEFGYYSNNSGTLFNLATNLKSQKGEK